MLKKNTIIIIVIIILILLCIILYNYYKNNDNNDNKQTFQTINEHFNTNSNMYAMATDNDNKVYYAVIPKNVTNTTPITWTHVGNVTSSISLSNNMALRTSPDGIIWYQLTPAIWLDSTGGTNWKAFASTSTGKQNNNFKTVSFDGYKMNAMAADNDNKAYYAVIPANLTPTTALTWIPNGGGITSISISNNFALSIDGGIIWYTLTPAIWQTTPGVSNWKIFASTSTGKKNENFKTVSLDGYNRTAMATDNANDVYYAVIPANLTPNTPITWTPVGNVTSSISLSNNIALRISPDGAAWYQLSPAIWKDSAGNSNWKAFASSPTGKQNSNFKTISFDNNQSILPTTTLAPITTLAPTTTLAPITTRAPPNLVLMGIGDDMIVGVTNGVGNGGTIFYADRNIIPSTPPVQPNYTVCPGTKQQLSVSNKQLYGVINGYVYYHPNYKNITTETWVLLTNRALSHVSFDGYNMIVMGVGAVSRGNGTTDGKIYYADQNVNTTTPLWVQVPSTLTSGATITSPFKKVSCSNKQAFALTEDNNIYYRANYKTGNWVKIPGLANDVSFDGYNMTVIVIGTDGKVTYADQNITTVANWTNVPGTLPLPGGIQQISVSNNQIMGVNTTNTGNPNPKGLIYYRANYKTGDWVQIPGGLRYISFDDSTDKQPTTTQAPTTTQVPTTTQAPFTTQLPTTTQIQNTTTTQIQNTTTTNNSMTTYPNTTDSNTTYPNTTNNSMTTYPNTTNTSMTTYPNTTDSNTTYPNTTNTSMTTYPNTTNTSMTTYPNTTDSNTTYPNTTDSNNTYPNTTDPNTTYPNTTNAYITTDPNTTNAYITTYPNTTDPNTTEPNTTNASMTTYPNTTNASMTTYPNTTNASMTTYPNTTNASMTTYPNTNDNTDTIYTTYPNTTYPNTTNTSRTTYSNTTKSNPTTTTSAELNDYYQVPMFTNPLNNLFISNDEKLKLDIAKSLLDGNEDSLQNTNGSPINTKYKNDILQLNSTLFTPDKNVNTPTSTSTIGDYATLDSIGKGLTDTLGGISSRLGYTVLEEQKNTSFQKQPINNPFTYDNISNYNTGINANTISGNPNENKNSYDNGYGNGYNDYRNTGVQTYGSGLSKKLLQNDRPVFLQKDFEGVANIFAPNIVIQNPPLDSDGYPDISFHM